MINSDAHDAPAQCENCGTPLLGGFCHACGQSIHSPTRHFGHAVEEFFEAFWHLDGRVFRTLRDLMFPGRVAANYLAGKRVRYIAPLRLFVILSLLTFFVGKLVVHVDQGAMQFGGEGGARIARAQTVAEVRQIENELLRDLAVEEAEAAKVPGVNAALIATRARIQGAAANRVVELERQGRGEPSRNAAPDPQSPAARAEAPPPVTAPAGARGKAAAKQEKEDDQIRFNGRPWDAKTNPVDLPLVPGFVDHWLNRKIGRAKENLERMDENVDQFVQAALGAVPTALFLLMPVFALLLKAAYLGSGRRYLEHVVVALYSHAWLLLVLLVMFVMNAIDDAFSAAWVPVATSLVDSALWLWAPIYLFLMQRRVYGGHWVLATLRYVVIGSVYLVLVLFAVVFAVLAGIAS